MNRRRLCFALFAFLQMFIAGLGGTQVAATTDETLLQKALANGLSRCYNISYMKNSVIPADVYNVSALIVGRDNTFGSGTGGFEDGVIKVPSKYGNTLRAGSADVSCYQLFAGWHTGLGSGQLDGLLDSSGKSSLNKETLLETLGYSVTGGGNSSMCISYTYDRAGALNSQTNTLCFPIDESGNVKVGGLNSSSDSSTKNGQLYLYLAGQTVTIGGIDSDPEWGYLQDRTAFSFGGWNTTTLSKDDFLAKAESGRSAFNFTYGGVNFGNANLITNANSEVNREWAINNWNNAALTALKNLTPYDSWGQAAFTSAEKYDLYMGYLTGIYNLQGSSSCSADKNASNESVPFRGDSGIKWCTMIGDLDNSTRVNILEDNSSRFLDKTADARGVIAAIRALDLSNVDLAGVDEGTGDVDQTVTITGDDASSCMSSGAAKSLGWILCPILDLMTDATTNMYNDYIKGALQVQPKLFQSSGGTNYTRDAWTVFQGIANVAFIILLLVVIFSQLTGVGIDNYGIKKILPKLIIAAILVNLSYYICVICVDLSNIVGNGIQALFNNISVTAPSSITIEGSSVPISGTGIGMTAIAVLAGVAGVGAIIINPAILLSLLVSALGILISVLFLFVLLSVREAAIVVLTVISPVAFVCYMLPNTKKFFDTWRKAGTGLLLVYPICGLMIGGGDYVSRLLLSINSGGGFFMALTAMVIGIAPIFFIPTLLKNSFSALGNIGAKISGLGEKVRGGAVRGMRGTDAYKNAQERGAERRTRIRAGIGRDGKESKLLTGFSRLTGGKRNVARNRSQYLKNQDARTREDSLMGVGFDAAVIGQTKRAEKDELANYMTLINEGTRNGDDETKLMRIYDDYMAKGNKLGAIAAARVAGRRKDTAAKFATSQFTNGNINKYSAEMARSIAKEVATGDNSGIFRSATPMQYQYASDVHSGAVSASTTYEQWKSDQSNVDRTMGAYITKSDELMGVNKKGLSEIAQLAQSGGMSDKEKTRLQNLARETINNRSRIAGWDTTKANEIATIAGWTYDEKTNTFSGEGVANTGSGSTGGNGGAVEGESFNVRGGDSGSGAAPSAPASNPAPASGNSAPAGSPAASPAPSNPPARPVNPLMTPAQSSESAQPSRSQADRTQPGEGPRIQIASEGDFQSFMRDRHS